MKYVTLPKTLLLLCLCLMTGTGFAQCSRDTTGANKFFIKTDKLQMGRTDKVRGKVYRYLHSRIEWEEKVTTIFLYPQYDDKVILDEGTVVYIKLEDATVLQLKATNASTSRFADGVNMKQGNSGYVWVNTVRLIPTAAELQTLLSKKIVKVRCHDVDYLCKDDEQTVISDLLRCIDSKKNNDCKTYAAIADTLCSPIYSHGTV